MRNVIQVFPHNETAFTGGGLGFIQNARDVCITKNIAGDLKLEFVLHCADAKRSICNPENICVADGQRFRIKTVDADRVSAVGIYQDAAFRHIQRIDDMIGKSPYEIMEKIFAGTPVHVMSEAEAHILGMEWVDDLTDFFCVSKVTPLGAMQNLTETLEKYRHHCEIYADNDRIALVKQIGADRGARLDTAYNAKEIKVKRDTTEILTRVYPYGKDDLHIGSVNNNVQYLDSPNYSTWQREGYQDFDEIEEPDELKTAGQWLFSENNPDRIDVPKYSVTVEYAQRKDREIRLGDIVTLVDREFHLTTKQRVTEVKIYPFEPNRNAVTIGNPPKTFSETFRGIANTAVKYENTTNARGDVKISCVEVYDRGASTAVNKKLQTAEKEKRHAAVHDSGDIWVNPHNENQALAIIGGVLAMANAKDENGDWIWSAFGDWTGFTANVMTAGVLNTSKVAVKSGDGNTQLSDNLLTMRDGNGTTRLKMGSVGGQYGFTLYDAQGKGMFYIDDDGYLSMKGTLDTTKTENGQSGYRIFGDTISGLKYSGGKLINHGLATTSDQYGSHLILWIDGVQGIHIHSFLENGLRKTAFAVHNSSDSSTSLRAFELVEGSDHATTKMWGDIDVTDSSFIADNSYAYNGTVTIGTAQLTIKNGLIMGVQKIS